MDERSLEGMKIKGSRRIKRLEEDVAEFPVHACINMWTMGQIIKMVNRSLVLVDLIVSSI